jgi:Zn-dependent M28 family amino/carboxypeptidase
LRRDQALHAQDAGAAAFLVGYPGRGPGALYRPTLIEPGVVEIPVVSVTDEAIRILRAADGDEAHLRVETEQAPSTLHNVVAQVGDGPRVVMLGAHLDSVLDGPGINDNGSGVAALLEVARGVVETGVPEGWTVRIGLWGAEEFGSIGSRSYVADLEDDVVAYLNLDMAGSPNGATLVYDEASAAPGSERITAAYETWLDELGEPSDRVDIGGSSDHFAFVQAGIPTGGLFAGAGETGSAAQPSASGAPGEPPDACYHLACDDIANVDLARVALFADATLGVTYQLMDAD